MKFISSNSIEEIVRENFYSTAIFHHYGIDYVYGGHLSLDEVCKQKEIDPALIINKLNGLPDQEEATAFSFSDWPLDLLVDYIEKKHHRYVDKAIAALSPLLDKVAAKYTDRHPAIGGVKQLFEELAGAFTAHMKKEEFMIFPFIKRMVLLDLQGKKHDNHALLESFENNVHKMLEEHEDEGAQLSEIYARTNGYQTSADADSLFIASMKQLESFEQDFKRHIYLENNILFPGALKLKQKIL